MSDPRDRPPVYPPPGDPVDPPTQRLEPGVARQPPPPGYGTGPHPPDPRPTEGRLESLRTALIIVGVIAVVAIGLAVWALIRANRNQGATHGAPTTPAAVVSLTTRVDRLESDVRSLQSSHGTGTANTGSMAAQVSQLAGREAALSSRVSQLVGKESALSSQVSGLQGRVSTLESQVSQLRAQSGSQTNTTGTSTG